MTLFALLHTLRTGSFFLCGRQLIATQLLRWLNDVANVRFSNEEQAIEVKSSAILSIISKNRVKGKIYLYKDTYYTRK